MKMKLYEIQAEILNLKQGLEERLESGDEPSLEEAKAILSLNNELKEKLNDKLIGYGHVIYQNEQEIDVLDREIKRLQAMKAKKAKLVGWLQATMIEAMQTHKIDEIKDVVMPVKLKYNTPSVVVDDVNSLPAEFVRTKTTVEPDKNALKEAMKNGLEFDGVRLERKVALNIG